MFQTTCVNFLYDHAGLNEHWKTMLSSFPEKELSKITKSSTIKCCCGTVILLVPNVKAMSIAIEAHVAKHLQEAKDPEEAERVRDDLIAQVLKIASES